MIYDFTTLPDRRHSGSSKWKGMLERKPNASPDAVPLTVADMEFFNPPEIIEGLKGYLDTAVLGYTSPRPAYFDAVTGWMRRRFGWEVGGEQIIETPGIVNALFALVAALTKPGDGVIVMQPVYAPFMGAITGNGRTVVDNPLVIEGGQYHIDLDDLRQKAADPANTMLILCSPHNPVGRVWTRRELTAVAGICRDNGLLIVSDEIHEDIVMPGHIHVTMGTVAAEAGCPCVVCTSPSKSFNLAGLQLSNVILPDEGHRRALRDLLNHRGAHGCNMLAYKACEIAYTQCDGWLDGLIAKVDENRAYVENFVRTRFPGLVVYPLEGTYLMWIDCNPPGIPEEELHEMLIERADAFFNAGGWFGEGGKGFVRINIACPTHVIEKLCGRIERAFL